MRQQLIEYDDDRTIKMDFTIIVLIRFKFYN